MRGQAFTLEAIVGGFVLVAALVFAVQVTAVTPLSASTSNQFIETQQAGTARGVLSAAGEESGVRDSALKRAVLFWGDEDSDGNREFHCANSGRAYFTGDPDLSTCNLALGDPFSDRIPPNELGSKFGLAYSDGVAYNIVLSFRTTSGDIKTQRLVFQGSPSDNAVQVTSLVTLYNNDELYTSEGVRSGTDIDSGAAAFYAPDAHGSGLYNVIKVEVTVWRI